MSLTVTHLILGEMFAPLVFILAIVGQRLKIFENIFTKMKAGKYFLYNGSWLIQSLQSEKRNSVLLAGVGKNLLPGQPRGTLLRLRAAVAAYVGLQPRCTA